MNRKHNSLRGSRKRAFEAGIFDGLEAPLRVFRFYISLDAPLTSRRANFASPRKAMANASKFIQAGFEAAKIDVARKSEERA